MISFFVLLIFTFQLQKNMTPSPPSPTQQILDQQLYIPTLYQLASTGNVSLSAPRVHSEMKTILNMFINSQQKDVQK